MDVWASPMIFKYVCHRHTTFIIHLSSFIIHLYHFIFLSR